MYQHGVIIAGVAISSVSASSVALKLKMKMNENNAKRPRRNGASAYPL